MLLIRTNKNPRKHSLQKAGINSKQLLSCSQNVKTSIYPSYTLHISALYPDFSKRWPSHEVKNTDFTIQQTEYYIIKQNIFHPEKFSFYANQDRICLQKKRFSAQEGIISEKKWDIPGKRCLSFLSNQGGFEGKDRLLSGKT